MKLLFASEEPTEPVEDPKSPQLAVDVALSPGSSEPKAPESGGSSDRILSPSWASASTLIEAADAPPPTVGSSETSAEEEAETDASPEAGPHLVIPTSNFGAQPNRLGMSDDVLDTRVVCGLPPGFYTTVEFGTDPYDQLSAFRDDAAEDVWGCSLSANHTNFDCWACNLKYLRLTSIA